MNLRALIGKLNAASRASLEGAAGLCLSRTHYDVEIEHWLLKLLDSNGTEFDLVLSSEQVDRAGLVRDLSRALDSFKTGNP
jgi:type VI secretion system protein VasG